MKKEGIQGVKKRGWEGRKEEEGLNKRGEKKSKQKSNMCQEPRDKNNVWNVWVKSSKR